jgi:hypothetical protein
MMTVTKYVRRLSPRIAKKLGKEELLVVVKIKVPGKQPIRYVASEAAVVKGKMTEPELIMHFLENAGISHTVTTHNLNEE